MTTSEDERHPGSNILSPSKDYWVSTGLFPQEVIISFDPPQSFRSIHIVSSNIRCIVIEGCESPQMGSFSKIGEEEFGNIRGNLQRETTTISFARSMSYVKITILSAWDNFVSIHSLKFD